MYYKINDSSINKLNVDTNYKNFIKIKANKRNFRKNKRGKRK